MLNLERIDAEIKDAGIAIDGVSLSPSDDSPNGRVDFSGVPSQAERNMAYAIFNSHFTPARIEEARQDALARELEHQTLIEKLIDETIKHAELVRLLKLERGRGL